MILFALLIFLFLGYILGRLFSSKLALYLSLISGLIAFLFSLLLFQLSYFDVPGGTLATEEYLQGLYNGIIVVVFIFVGSKLGFYFKNLGNSDSSRVTKK